MSNEPSPSPKIHLKSKKIIREIESNGIIKPPQPIPKPKRKTIGERCGILKNKITSRLCNKKVNICSGFQRIGWFYRHPVSRLLVISCLMVLDIISYPEDPIYYSQTLASVPILGLTINGLLFSYVEPSRFPKYFAYQIFSQLFFVITFVVFGEFIIRKLLFQKLLDFRAFKRNNGILISSVIWAILGLWFCATTTNFFVTRNQDHSLRGFLDFVLEEDSNPNIGQFYYNNTDPPNQQFKPNQFSSDLTFKFLKWMEVIDYGIEDNYLLNPDGKIKYLTPLMIKDDLPLSNETFCRIARLLVSFGDMFTFFSIFDMIMQDKKHYTGCCYKIKTTGCWDRHRVKVFWIYISIVSVGLILSAGSTFGWNSLSLIDNLDWKGKVIPITNSSPTTEYNENTFLNFVGKNQVILAFDNEGQMPADRYTLYDSLVWQTTLRQQKDFNISTIHNQHRNDENSNDIQSFRTTFFSTGFLTKDTAKEVSQIFQWLSPQDLNDQRIVGEMTKNLIEDYQNGTLSNLDPHISEFKYVNQLPTGDLRHLKETTKFKPLNLGSDTWDKNRGYFYTTEIHRIVIKIMVMLLDMMILHQDPQFPHFEEKKKKRNKIDYGNLSSNDDREPVNEREIDNEENEEEEEEEEDPIKLVGLEGHTLDCKTLSQTFQSCFDYRNCFSPNFTSTCRKNKKPRDFEDDEDSSSWDFSDNIFGSMSSSEEEEDAWDRIIRGKSKNFSRKNCQLNISEAFENCLPVFGITPNADEKIVPHRSAFGGEAPRYRFNKNCCARIFCSCCNQKPIKSEETARIRAKNLCLHSCKNLFCCVPNITKRNKSIKGDSHVLKSTGSLEETTAKPTIKNKKKLRSKKAPFITARRLTYSVFIIIVCMNEADLLQQVLYDPASYGQIVDTNNRIHCVYPNKGILNEEDSFKFDILFSALYLMSPSEVSISTEEIESNSYFYLPHNNYQFSIWNFNGLDDINRTTYQEPIMPHPKSYSNNYGREPHIKYSEKHVGWSVTLKEFYSSYEEISVSDGVIQKEPLGSDYALDILFNFVTKNKIDSPKTNNDNINNTDGNNDNMTTEEDDLLHLVNLKKSVSKKIEWIYIYEEESGEILNPKTFMVSELCHRRNIQHDNVSKGEQEEPQKRTYKLYGVSCKCWKLTGLKLDTKNPDINPIEKHIDGIYNLGLHRGKTSQDKYKLESIWENRKVRTSDNKLSSIRFQKLTDKNQSYGDLGTLQQCHLNLIENQKNKTKEYSDLFFDLSKDDYLSSHLPTMSPMCSSLELHTLIVTFESLSKLLSRSNEVTKQKFNQTCERKPFVETKWLEHCHEYQENVDVRCGPCNQVDHIDSISTKEYLSNLLSTTSKSPLETVVTDEINQDKSYDIDREKIYTVTKKKLAYLVDLWESSDASIDSDDLVNKDIIEPNENKNIAFWFGHRGETLLLSEGYIPSSNKAYKNEELPVLLTQKYSPILTLGPLNMQYIFVPLRIKFSMALIPVLLLTLLLAKIITSYVYRSLKNWERKLLEKLAEGANNIRELHVNQNPKSSDSFDVIELEEDRETTFDSDFKLDTTNPRYAFSRCKLTFLFCCRKMHRSKKKTLNPDVNALNSSDPHPFWKKIGYSIRKVNQCCRKNTQRM